MNAAPFDRGRAARRKGLPKSASPYKHPERQTGRAFDWERRASEWDEGWDSFAPGIDKLINPSISTARAAKPAEPTLPTRQGSAE